MIRSHIKYPSALAALALVLSGIGTSYGKPVDNNWTLVGPSAGGGFVIQGSGPLDLGPLSLNTSPVHLSPNGFDIITLNAGSTASDFTDTIVLDQPPGHDTLNNYGTILGQDSAIVIGSDHNTINNWGTINGYGGSASGIDIEHDFTIVNNRGIILSGDDGISIEGGQFNIINNWGTVSGKLEGIVFTSPNNTLNNWGTVSSLNAGVFTDEPNTVINNWGTITANSAGTFPAASAIEIDSVSTTINNWGVITANGGPVAIDATGNQNTLNLNGHSSVMGKISFQGNGNVVNLNFTGLTPSTIATLKAQLTPQGVDTGVSTSSVQFTLRGVSYDIDPAVVNFNPSSYQLQGITPNQQAIGASLDSAITNPALGSPLFALFNGIDTSGNVSAALESLSPQEYQAYGDLAIANFTATVQNVDARLNNLRDGSESLDAAPSTQTTAGYSKDDGKDAKNVVPTPAPEKRWGFFATGDGLFFRGSSHDLDAQNVKSNSAGTLAGVDAKIGDHVVAGALFAYNNSDTTLGSGNSHATIESYSGGLYGSYHQDGFYVNGLAAYTRNHYSSDRNILFPGFASTAAANTNGNQESVNLDGGYDWHVTDRLTVGPIVGLQYVHLDVNGFNEIGAGAANLAINSQRMNSLQSRVGGRLDYHLIAQEHIAFAADLHAAWQHEYLDDSRGIGASFIGSGLTPFSVQTTSPLRDAGVVGVGLNFTFHERLTLFADYELLMWRASYFEQTVNAGGRVSF